MESKIPEIKPMALEPWVMPDTVVREPALIRPVARNEGAAFRKLQKEPSREQKDRRGFLKPHQARQIGEQIEQYLSDMELGISLEIYDNMGDLVVKMINRETREAIRQIPPEDLLDLRDKLEELRGVFFAGKA